MRQLAFLAALTASIPACSSSDDGARSSGVPEGGAPDGSAGGDSAAHGDSSVEGGTPPGDDAAPPDASNPDATAAAWKCPAGPFAKPIPQGAKATLVAGVPLADGFVSGEAVLEGAVWIDGALYMSQFLNGVPTPASRILRWSPSDGASIFSLNAGSNGLAVDANGALLAAMHSDGSVSRIASGKAQAIASQFGGKRFDSPNDLTARSDGTIYFTDPDWQSAAAHPQPKTRVYRIDPAGAVTIVDDQLNEPNGITLAPDASVLYVSSLDGIEAFDVAADGTTSGKRAFSALSSDGMGIDCAGNLYATVGSEVVVLAASGTEVGRIPVDGVEALTNAAFGGDDRKTLFITSRGTTQTLHRVDLAVPGFPY